MSGRSVRVRSGVLRVGGVLLIAAGAAHATGFAQFDEGLAAAPPATRAGLHAGWLWGSVAFFAFGISVLVAARLWRHGQDPRPSVLPVAVALVGFGACAFVARDCNPHFLGFVGLGLLIGLPMLGAGAAASRGQDSQNP